MTTAALDPAVRAAAEERLEQLEGELEGAQQHPADWLKHTKAIDPKSGSEFRFEFGEGWEWQRDELDTYLQNQVILRLKARQLGVSWLGIGYCAWKCLTHPGTRALAVSINEVESVKLIGRAWDLWENSPEHLRFEGKVLKPERGRPSSRIEWEFPDGRISSLIVMPSTPRAGHGETDDIVRSKAEAGHRAGLTAIICVGETAAERKARATEGVLDRQVAGSVPAAAAASRGTVRISVREAMMMERRIITWRSRKNFWTSCLPAAIRMKCLRRTACLTT